MNSTGFANLGRPFTDRNSGIMPTRENVGVTQTTLLGLMTKPRTTILSNRQEVLFLKHGPDTVIGEPPNNDDRFGESSNRPESKEGYDNY